MGYIKSSSGESSIFSAKNNLPVDSYFNIQKSVLAMKSIWDEQARKNNSKIQTVFDKDIPNILPINAQKIQHCLNNLAANAVNATNNGTINIVVSQLCKPDAKLNIQTFLVISVQDTGPGLSTQQMKNLFAKKCKPRSPHHSNYGVVDTGLPMTQNLIAELGGKLYVKSDLGKGSTFSLVLPLANISAEKTANNSANIGNIGSYFYDLNIMVVDDYNLNHLTLKALLQDNVAKVHTALHGHEALEILHSCPIDLIFMDIHMPILDGIETTLKIRESKEIWSGVHIIAMTADPDYQHMHLCRKIGMDDALAKPFRVGDIYSILDKFAPAYKIATAR